MKNSSASSAPCPRDGRPGAFGAVGLLRPRCARPHAPRGDRLRRAFASLARASGTALVALGLLVLPGVAWAGAVEDGLACLERADLVCAERAATSAPAGAEGDLLRARVAFHRAEFATARTLLESATRGKKDKASEEERALYQRTAEVTAGFRLVARDGVEVRHAPGVDQVLVDDCIEVLAAARDRIGPRLGGVPPGPIRVEIYPSGRSFIAASSLPAEAVETTGVIALSKWSRLLLTSPRALGRGYGWKDTLAHEYIHEVVAWRTRDRAPVWLQEGLARSHEPLWRRPAFAPPAPLARSLLARALAKDALVPLKKMHPSMAFLGSADEAALAYAQVDSMVQFLAGRAGEGGVARLLDTVRDGTDALEAWSRVAGGEPDAMLAEWRTYLGTLGLRDTNVASRPVALGAQDDPFATDPVLARRRDLAGHARLGDLLMEAGRADAALAEYAKAKPEDEPPSPSIVTREARALDAVGRRADAIRALEASIADYPEEADSHRVLAELHLAAGRRDAALSAFRASADVYPFDPAVQGALADLHGASGQRTLADRHAGYRRVLELGGDLPTSGASR